MTLYVIIPENCSEERLSDDIATACAFYDREAGGALAASGGVMLAQSAARILAGNELNESTDNMRDALARIDRARRLRAAFDLPTPSWEADDWVVNVIAACVLVVQTRRPVQPIQVYCFRRKESDALWWGWAPAAPGSDWLPLIVLSWSGRPDDAPTAEWM